MREHQQQAVQRLAERFSDDPRFLALIIGGSVASGRARDDSDIDVILVATDEEWALRKANRDYFYYSEDLCDYAGGYVDGKVVDKQFLLDAAERGNESTRAAFSDTVIIYSHIPELGSILQRIPVYPEHDQRRRIAAFYSQVLLQSRFFILEAEKRKDPFLLAHAAASSVLFGGRLILACNKMLFRSFKWLLSDVAEAPDKPADFLQVAERLLKEPSAETARAFCACISNHRDWGVTMEQAVSWFIEDNEWNWREGKLSVQDW